MLTGDLRTLKQVSEATGIPIRNIMYRIKNKEVKAGKIGWFWVMEVNEIDKLKQLCGK